MDDARKHKKRPCSVCRRWFRPAPRTAHCQRTCSAPCSKELAGRRDAKWRARNPDAVDRRRLLDALKQADDAVIEIAPATSPLAKVPWRVLQVALGGKTAVALAFALRLHASPQQVAFEGKTRILTRVPVRLKKTFEQVPLGQAP